jgi:hypothetical protein
MKWQTYVIKSRTNKTLERSVDSTNTKLPNLWKQNLLVGEYSATCGLFLKAKPLHRIKYALNVKVHSTSQLAKVNPIVLHTDKPGNFVCGFFSTCFCVFMFKSCLISVHYFCCYNSSWLMNTVCTIIQNYQCTSLGLENTTLPSTCLNFYI